MKLTKISMKSSIASLLMGMGVLTITAGDQTAFNPGDKIGVYTDNQDKVIYTLSADGTTVENDAQNFSLPTGQGTPKNIAGADYMTFNPKVTRTNGSANLSLQMQRRTARVIINITFAGDEIDKENDVIYNATIKSLYKTYTNNVASDNTTRSISAYTDRKGMDGFNAESATRFTALVIPATEATESSYRSWLDITVEDKNNNYKHFYVSTIPAMEADKSYTYT